MWPNARWLRIGDNSEELRENRRGEVELFAHPGLALAALTRALPGRSPNLDTAWRSSLRSEHLRRAEKYATGGDLLSFARMGLDARTYLDAGAFGCLGVGTPYGIAAALLYPHRQVVVVTGDGAFGINAMEIDTAQRHGAKVVFIVANNAAWNIERYDQEVNYGGRIIGTTLAWSDYATMARAFGLHGERVTEAVRLPGAIQEAFERAPALIDVVITRDAPSSDAGKGLGWVPDFQALTAWDDAEQARRR